MNTSKNTLEFKLLPARSVRRKLVLVWGAALVLWCGHAAADTVRLAAGDYAPFVARKLPEYGVTAAIVTAAFKTQGATVSYDFLSWKRGYHQSRLGEYVGTFPYLLTPERETDFLYSDPIFTDQFRLFVRKSEDASVAGKSAETLLTERAWTGKSICAPLGHDTTPIRAFTAENQLKVEQPAEISSCFSMLEMGSVEAVWVSQLVGRDTVRALYGRNRDLYPQELQLPGISGASYYFIVSRALPGAQGWIDRFNAGMRVLRTTGAHGKILARYVLP